MSYVKKSFLLENSYSFSESRHSTLSKSAAVSSKSPIVFLSHSHRDKDLVNGIRKWFHDKGINVYIDWLDETLPSTVSQLTAVKIKNKIYETNVFILVCTENSKDSRWVPWELGLGDALKGMDKVAILPVADDYGNYAGSEYLGAYSRIEIGDRNELGVFKPGENTGVTLKSWIK